MKKRGQLTIFIILAILIVLAIVFYFYFSGSFSRQETYDPKVQVLKNNVLDCFTENYKESLEIIGTQGGYLNVPEPKQRISILYFSFDIPYYYHLGNLNIPSRTKIQTEINKVSQDLIDSCFEEYSSISDYESIEFSGKEILTKITPQEVIFTANIFMNVNYDGKSARVDFSKYPLEVKSRLYDMHQVSEFIAQYYKENNEWTPFSEIVDFSKRYDLYIGIEESDDANENSIKIMTDKQDYFPSVYIFKNKFSHESLGGIEPLL